MTPRPFRTNLVAGILAGGILALAMGGSSIAKDELQPDRLNFGVVHLGARVQGSVRAFVDPKEIAASKVKVVAPDFVTVDSVNQGVQEYGGARNARGYCDIAITVDTRNVGKFSMPMVMSLGEHRIEVPVSAEVRPRNKAQARVLVVDTPFQRFSTNDASLFDPWLKLVERGGFDVEYREIRLADSALKGIDLAQFDSILLGELGIIRLDSDDIAALRRYAENGGRVILTANHFFMGTVPKANKVLLQYGLEIQDTENPVQGAIEVRAPHIIPCPLTDGVTLLSFHRPSPAVVIDQDRTMVLVGSPNKADEHYVAIALAGKGQIVSLGVSLWWSWVGKADNAILLENLLRRKPRAD